MVPAQHSSTGCLPDAIISLAGWTNPLNALIGQLRFLLLVGRYLHASQSVFLIPPDSPRLGIHSVLGVGLGIGWGLGSVYPQRVRCTARDRLRACDRDREKNRARAWARDLLLQRSQPESSPSPTPTPTLTPTPIKIYNWTQLPKR